MTTDRTAKVTVRKASPAHRAPPANDPPTPEERDRITVQDALGRAIEVKKLGALDRMRLALMVGAEAAENPSFMLYANLAASVAGIEGQALPPPQTHRELEARVQRLEEIGLQAVIDGWQKAGWMGSGTPEEASERHLDDVKN
jgi:hypothetical protein